MFEQPQAEHAWLEQLVGQWISEMESQAAECATDSEVAQPATGRMTCRSLGGLWLIAEGEGQAPDGGVWSSIITLGFDPKQQRYIGTFVASMMTHLWPYSGVLDATGKKLPLDSEGPKFDGSGITKYRDTIEIVDKDHWIFTGEVLADDGTWQPIMTAHNRRA